ncbi:hypothetical protein [Vibrio cidicii]|uniref:hypothetical protein n=1 Tax=Vibrio cidicii TaxID=1763883 RepID=UPI0008196309|nr:hypothetical protein [Vibrio cidicii]
MKFKSPFLVLLVLVGCGGNDDNNVTPSQPNPPSPNQGISITDIRLKSELYSSHRENEYTSQDSLLALASTDGVLDGSQIFTCSWKIGDKKVSDSCNYTLSKGEHILPIEVSINLQYHDQLSSTFTKTFNKAFPIDQVSNDYSKVTLYSDGTILEWDHILDGSMAYHAVGRFQKLSAVDNSGFKKIFATQFAFGGLKSNGNFYVWGPINHSNDHLSFINSEGIKDISLLDHYFAVLTEAGNVFLVGKDDKVEKLQVSSVNSIFSSNESLATESDQGETCIFNIKNGSKSCSTLAGSVVKFSELKDSYLGNYAILTDQSNLYRWDPLSNSQAEEVSDGVRSLINNDHAFAYITQDNSVGVWGNRAHGGTFSYDYYTFEQQYVATTKTCRLDENYDGIDSVCGWRKKQVTIPAHYETVKKSTSYNLEVPLTNVKSIDAASNSFAATTFDGKVVTWGSIFTGGNIYSESVKHDLKLTDVVNVASNGNGYSAILSDGSVISWQGIWDLGAKVESRGYTPFYYYDNNRPSHIDFSDIGGVGISGKAGTLFSNEGAYLFVKDYQSTEQPYVIVMTWGFKEAGGSYRNQEISARIERVVPVNAGFALYTDNGDIYILEEERPLRLVASARPY